MSHPTCHTIHTKQYCLNQWGKSPIKWPFTQPLSQRLITKEASHSESCPEDNLPRPALVCKMVSTFRSFVCPDSSHANTYCLSVQSPVLLKFRSGMRKEEISLHKHARIKARGKQKYILNFIYEISAKALSIIRTL